MEEGSTGLDGFCDEKRKFLSSKDLRFVVGRFIARYSAPTLSARGTDGRGVAPLGLSVWGEYISINMSPRWGLERRGYAGAINMPPHWGCAILCHVFWHRVTVLDS